MKNGTGAVGTIVLFGGTSELGISTVAHLLTPTVQNIVLVSRDIEKAQTVEDDLIKRSPQADITHIRFDGADAESMYAVVEEIVSAVGDIDVAIIAHALLGNDIDGYSNPSSVKALLDVNVTATMALMFALAAQMRLQRHGRIALFSSVAGVRVRKANAPYGASKAAIDAFALALDHDLQGSGASVVVIRPGFVHTKMTSGMKVAPFATNAHVVGERAARGISEGQTVVWVPGIMRFIFGVFAVLPRSVWRRLPVHD
jgi:decaprenylphospho-beta-D-erythro-pentofuranosid-2-ulose 2-reductase